MVALNSLIQFPCWHYESHFFFFWSSEHRDGTNKYGYNISIFVQLSFGSNVNHDLSKDFCVCWLDFTAIFPLQSKKRYK